jgi:hypothetical protein
MRKSLGIRSGRGNMMAFMLGTMLVMTLLILFGLWYTQHTLNGTSHRSAIDSAALAAASALGRIVVKTPEYGYVSLVGGPPTSNKTKAGDNYFQRVYSINEIMGTARLDACLAEAMNDDCLRKLAKNDADAAKSAAGQLFSALSSACGVGASGKDIDGNDVSPYNDALSLYMSNPSLSSAYVPNSLQIDLGGLNKGIGTAIPVPTSKGLVSGGDQIGNRYISDRDIPVNGNHYVFAAVGDQPALVKSENWTPTVSGLPYQMPAVVRVQAKQVFKEQGRSEQQKYMSCATAGGDQHATAAGAFAVACPDGNMDEISSVGALWSGFMNHDIDANPLLSQGGDFPTGGGKLVDAFCDDGKVAPPNRHGPQPWNDPSNPKSSEIALCMFYDWVRQGGPRVDIDSMIDMTSAPLKPPTPALTKWFSLDLLGVRVSLGNVPTGVMHIFKIDPNTGKYTYKNKVIKPEPYYVAFDNQMYVEDTNVNSSTPKETWGGTGVLALVAVNPFKPGGIAEAQEIKVKNTWDFYFRDYCRLLGPANGGKHVGEPMVTDEVAWKKDYGTHGSGAGKPRGSHGGGLPPIVSEALDGFFTALNAAGGHTSIYETGQTGPASGQARPSYLKDGLDCIVTMRRQLDVHDLGISGISTGYKGLME